MSLHLKFRNWITLCILLPGGLLLILANGAFWLSLKKSHAQDLKDQHSAQFSMLEGVLKSEQVRLRSIASMPITKSILQSAERRNQNTPVARREQINQTVQDVWAGYDRNNLQVRNVLDNVVADLFGHLSRSKERTSELILTDSTGALLAASTRPERYAYHEEAWWLNSRNGEVGGFFASDVNLEGEIFLSLPLLGDYETKVLQGVLREKLVLSDFGGRSGEEEDSATVLVGGNSWFVDGHAQLAEEFLALGEEVDFSFTEDQWMDGFRVMSRKLDSGLVWESPVWLVTLRKESMFPAGVYLPTLMLIGLSSLALGLLVYTSNRAGRSLFFEPLHELIEAGVWAINRSGERDPNAKELDLKDYVEEIEGKDVSTGRVRRDLEEWMSSLKQEMQDAIYSKTYEMQKDIELARDFQMAYLNRPYPQIPANHIEGRLRLKFCHRYHPAMALGGDFFDFVKLSDETAGVFIADVMGHGTRSALITAILRTLISDLFHQGRNARHFMAEINKQFCELLSGVPNPQFASCFYFVADTTARVATYSSAGHPTPILLRRSVGRIQHLQVPEPKGAALGLIPDEEYTGGHTRLQDGDVFLFYTDGYYEATNQKGEEFGFNRMEKTLKTLLYKPCGDILDGLMTAIQDFAKDEPLADDICLVAVEVTTRAEA